MFLERNAPCGWTAWRRAQTGYCRRHIINQKAAALLVQLYQTTSRAFWPFQLLLYFSRTLKELLWLSIFLIIWSKRITLKQFLFYCQTGPLTLEMKIHSVFMVDRFCQFLSLRVHCTVSEFMHIRDIYGKFEIGVYQWWMRSCTEEDREWLPLLPIALALCDLFYVATVC